MNSRRIILFNNTLSGGAGKSILTLAAALAAEDTDVHLLIYENRIDYPVPPKVTLHNLSGKAGRALEQALQYRLQTLRPFNLLISNSTPANKMLSRLHIPDAYHCIRSSEYKEYSGLTAPLRRMWRRHTYRRLYDGKNLITISRGLEKYILEEIKASPASIRTLYNPFDFDEIRQRASATDPEIPSAPYLIHVGRFDMASKRHDILLEAYRESGIDYPLVLLGQGRDEVRIREAVEQLGLGERVLMPGFRNNPYPWIRQAELLVLSSDFEGFPRVLAESLILGTPVVSTDCPTGPSEILTGALTPYLSPPGDAKTLAKNIISALRYYPSINTGYLERFQNRTVVREYLALADRNSIHFTHGNGSASDE